MAYEGWDREVMRAAPNDPPAVHHRGSSAFTPINQRIPLPSMGMLDPVGRFEGDSLYELCDDPIPQTTTKTTKKRKTPPAKGRIVSLEQVWQYEDEGDIYNNGAATEEPLPEKKKKAVSKRSQSMRIPSTSNTAWDDGESSYHGEEQVERGSQLTTPLDSSKGKQTKVGSVASKNKGKQNPAFKNPTITKPSLSREKKVTPARSAAINSLQGWRSTEESVKSTSVHLAKTTMEKLASFRFNPPPEPQDTPFSLSQIHNLSSHNVVDSRQYELLPETSHPSSDYDLPDGELFFENALYEMNAHTIYNGDTQIQNQHAADLNPAHVNEQAFESELPESDLVRSKPVGNIGSRASPHSATTASEFRRSENLVEPAEDSSNTYDPTSSEARALVNLKVTVPDVSQMSQPVDDGAMSSQGIQQLQRQKQSFANQITEGYEVQIQIERSDIDEPDNVSKEAPRDLWGSDEYDQGLDDDDLLAIVSNTTIPQTQDSQRPQQKKVRVCGPYLLHSTPVEPDPFATGPLALPKHTRNDIIEIQSSSPKGAPELDDEFPMDEEDEAELHKMSDVSGISKHFALPESVVIIFNELAEAEVYDSSLQFSPPKEQISGATPSKVTNDQNTNKNRTSQSPGHGLPLEEEEDWSFFRSNDHDEAETMPDTFHETQADTPPPARPHQSLASTPVRRNMANQPNVHTPTQKTTDTAWSSTDDSHEYEPMKPFARPDFPNLVLDRSPVVGLSSQTYLRTCFRIGEMFKERIWRASLGQDAVIELFCRVTFSSREPGSTKQHFQFSDLWHDRPPYPNGLLANFKTTGLAESDSKVFLSGNGKMARCLGRFKRDLKNSVWVLHIISIRETDWEDIRWTKQVVSHLQVKKETGWTSVSE